MATEVKHMLASATGTHQFCDHSGWFSERATGLQPSQSAQGDAHSSLGYLQEPSSHADGATATLRPSLEPPWGELASVSWCPCLRANPCRKGHEDSPGILAFGSH